MGKFFYLLAIFTLFFSFLLAQNPLEDVKKEIDQQEKRIRELEKELATKEAKREKELHSEDKLEQRIEQYLTEKLNDPKQSLKIPLTLKSKWIQFGGDAKLNFIDYRNRGDVAKFANPESHFAFDRVTFKTKVRFHDYVYFYSSIEFDEADDGVKVDQAYLSFQTSDILGSPDIRIGLTPPRYKFDRRTERYPIIGNIFFEEEELGIQMTGGYKFFFFAFDFAQARKITMSNTGLDRSSSSTSVSTPPPPADDPSPTPRPPLPMGPFPFVTPPEPRLRIENRQALFFPNTLSVDNSPAASFSPVEGVSKIIQDGRNDNIDKGKHLGRIASGFRHDFKEFGKIQAFGFLERSRLDEEDIEFLVMMLADYRGDYSDDEKQMWGLIADYSLPTNLGLRGTFFTQGAFFKDKTGQLERHGYYMQASHQWILNQEFLYSLEGIARYGRYQIGNIQTDNTNPLSWDREELTLGLFVQVRKNITFKFEYTFEEAFRSSPGNNLHLDYFNINLEITF